MKYKILIADPSSESIKSIKGYLTPYPEFKILTAQHGKNIFEALEQHPPDLLLLNGKTLSDSYELIEGIRSSITTHNLPMLLILNKGENMESIKHIFETGIIDFVFNPIDKDELVLRLHSLLSKNHYFIRFLHQAEQIEQLATIASKSSNSVAIINPKGRIEWVNEGFINMYEYSFEEFKRQFEHSLFNPELNSNFRNAINQSISEKKNIIYENHWITKSGKEKWIQTTLTPIFNEKTGQVVRLFAIETDITKIKKTETRLEEQNKYLLKLTKHLETTNDILEKQRKEIEYERQKADDLLFNTFPYTIAKQLKSKGEAGLKTYKLVTVMFTDFKGFTRMAEIMDNQELIKELSNFFETFEEITGRHYIEKIKTIGDSYMCAGGLPIRNKSNPIDVVLASLEIQHVMKGINEIKRKQNVPTWDLRLGVHSGEVIAGIIGKKKFAYDIWGDTVNTASRMESSGDIGKVNISGDTYKYICDFFDCTYRGKISVKYKGEMEMYFVNRLKPEYAKDETGIIPNDTFNKILSTI